MTSVGHDMRDELYSILGKKIRDARKERGLTQAELAEASSLSRTSITNIEHGRQHLPLHTLYDVAFALVKEVPDLLPEIHSPSQRGLGDRIPDDLDKDEREWIKAIVSRK